ncbi:DUF4062 domain-containing protein [Modestobacter sp. VKM Ac-2977]|uniref:DUF4062 domain-containing protein n=1 Tax=Modestobacter sp. VKM Ac-2977 TaxID=3004131 RepID=UPI0022AA2593|nr:DUF4062 domain-containing protein [Modestobacter sp. VKM Ac-2977]MCZ2819734.1 DUF4062 domain-containing protein [Modestobacter sp. VKM Ac-2977]
MEKRYYQVFVSSTYIDLVDEREQVTEQLLRSRCIPSGMELFTASGRPPWDVITSAIETTDYMVLILGGRYGSVGDDGRSFTEREYDEAQSRGIPVLAFLHEDVDSLPRRNVDVGEEGESLAKLRAKVSDSERQTVQFWSDARDLAQKVGTAIREAIINEPRPGWVRGGDVRVVDEGSGSDQESDQRVPPLPSLTSTSDELRETLALPGGEARLERSIGTAIKQVKRLPFIVGDAEYDGVANLDAERAQRMAALEDAAPPLVLSVAAAARWGTPDLDQYLCDLVEELNSSPRRSGYTSLIDMMRAPAVLVFTAAGVGACAGKRDDLVGLLLSEELTMDDPMRDEDAPVASLLSAGLLYPYGWPSKSMREYFEKALGADPAWEGSVLDRAWERWEYLAAVARLHLSERFQTPRGERPYLRIEDGAGRARRTTVGKSIRRQVKQAGEAHPLMRAGLCKGSAEAFEGAAASLDGDYGAWGENQDFAALPGMGGALPSGPHYPGSRSGF